ncbi:PilZ domain-containing protein [Neobacillus mesonae]|uniref:PilZ domain-containing protein n=1 Tax=Neobacillus mesonae TaxID=1193713 RepID=UPI00203E98DB|nr:PilZ domain-containing protein [Neobacillus mesonae]MCM3569576.1 PilZ domain-containing protein [Neobacillus mesonae]
MDHNFEQREFKRFIFKKPVEGSIEPTIPYTGHAKKTIWILDMSAGGLKFVCEDAFFVNYIELYKIKTTILNKELLLFGKIIRKKQLTKEWFQFSIQFNFDYHPNMPNQE